MKSKIWGVVLGFLLLMGTGMTGQTMAASVWTGTQGWTVVSSSITPGIQSKIDAIVLKVKSQRARFVSSEAWNQYLDKIIGQINILITRHYSNTRNIEILNTLSREISALKETGTDLNVGDLLSDDTLPSLPFCAQPPMPTCPANVSCPQAFPSAKTYTNYTDWKNDRATYLHAGLCELTPRCPVLTPPAKDWCIGNVIPQGKDANGCQLAPKCEPIVQCPVLTPPSCPAPGVVTSKKDANGCISYSCEITQQCPTFTPPVSGWCTGKIIDQGKDANGCQLAPKCESANYIPSPFTSTR